MYIWQNRKRVGEWDKRDRCGGRGDQGDRHWLTETELCKMQVSTCISYKTCNGIKFQPKQKNTLLIIVLDYYMIAITSK